MLKSVAFSYITTVKKLRQNTEQLLKTTSENGGFLMTDNAANYPIQNELLRSFVRCIDYAAKAKRNGNSNENETFTFYHESKFILSRIHS